MMLTSLGSSGLLRFRFLYRAYTFLLRNISFAFCSPSVGMYHVLTFVGFLEGGSGGTNL